MVVLDFTRPHKQPRMVGFVDAVYTVLALFIAFIAFMQMLYTLSDLFPRVTP